MASTAQDELVKHVAKLGKKSAAGEAGTNLICWTTQILISDTG